MKTKQKFGINMRKIENYDYKDYFEDIVYAIEDEDCTYEQALDIAWEHETEIVAGYWNVDGMLSPEYLVNSWHL
jgi:hypothetical protein